MRFSSWAALVASSYDTILLPGGLVWTLRSRPSTAGLDIAYGNGVFIVTGGFGVTPIRSSDDGATWSTVALTNAYTVVFDEVHSVFVAITHVQAYHSPDGVTWTPATTFASENGTVLAYGNGICVTVGWGGGKLQVSTDGGVNWSNGIKPTGFDTQSPIAYGNDVFLQAVNAGSVFRSANGVTWSNLGAVPITGAPILAYGQGGWLCMSAETNTTNVYRSTDDGATWNLYTTRPTGYVRSLKFAQGVWLAASTAKAIRSVDGSVWASVQGGLETNTPDWYDTAASPTSFVIVGSSAGNPIRTSPTKVAA